MPFKEARGSLAANDLDKAKEICRSQKRDALLGHIHAGWVESAEAARLLPLDVQ